MSTFRHPPRVMLGAAAVLWVGGILAAHGQELRLWVYGPNRGLEASVRVWEGQHPGWRVVTSIYLDGDNPQQLLTSVSGGDPPDVIQQDRFTIGEWAARGAFLALDPYLERLNAQGGDTTLRANQFYEACWKEANYNGKVYAIPMSTDSRALYYNEDLLRRAGFVDDEGRVVPPRTWNELRDYSARLTERDADGRLTQLGFAPNYGNSWLYIYGWLNGGRFLSDDGRTVRLDSPEVVEALAYMVDLYEVAGGAVDVDRLIGAAQGNELDPFATGRVAMKIDGDWFLNILAEYHPYLRFGVAPPPAPRDRPSVTWSGGHSWVIPVSAKHPQLAFDLIRFLVSPEGWAVYHHVNRQYAQSKGRAYIPRMTAQPDINETLFGEALSNDPNVPRRVLASIPVFLELMKTARFRPVTPVGKLMWDEQVRAIERSVRGGVSPSSSLGRGSARVQERLDEALAGSVGTPVRWPAVTVGFLVASLVAGAAGMWIVWRRGVLAHYHRDELRASAFFVSPWLVGFLVLTAGPVVVSLIYSFCQYDVLSPAAWVGLKNYRRLVTNDPLFWKSLANTAYMLLGIPLGMALGLGIALLLNLEVRGMRVYRTVFYLPTIVPLVASSILWLWVLNPETGLVNSILRTIGFTDVPGWLNSPSWLLGSKAAIILMGLWTAGSGMIIWLAGLNGIPSHLYEAAQIDGAGPVRRFLHVSLPMLTPYILFNLIMGTIGTMQIFTQAYIMTKGGPADSTLYYAYYLFNNAFEYFEMGYASALAWVLFILVMVLAGLQLWSSKKWIYYEAS